MVGAAEALPGGGVAPMQATSGTTLVETSTDSPKSAAERGVKGKKKGSDPLIYHFLSEHFRARK